MSWWDGARRRPQPEAAAATRPGASLSAVAEAADAARTGAGEALDRLAGLLPAVDEAGDAALAREALGVVRAMPRVTVRLDEHSRRSVGRKRIRASAALGPDTTGMLRVWLSGSADTAGTDS